MRDKKKKGKKPPGVGIDFKKAKSKVGKKLPKAENETNTKIQSRTINLPGQSVAEDRTGTAVSSRNLTLRELLAQCQHYSESKRKDALDGIQEILSAEPAVLQKEAGAVVEQVAELASDPASPVRAALASLLGGLLLPRLGRDRLAPFLPLLMAHVGSAMTHLDPKVRASALGLLDLLLERAAGLVAARFRGPVLAHYAHMMSSRGRAVSEVGMAAALQAVGSLRRFLAATAPAGSRGAGRGEALARGHAVLAGTSAAPPPSIRWGELAEPPPLCAPWWADPPSHISMSAAAGWGGGEGDDPEAVAGAGGAGGGGGGEGDALLLDRLWDVWAECAPAQQAISPELAAVRCLSLCLRCAALVLAAPAPAGAEGGAGAAARARDAATWREQWLARWARALAPIFPFTMPAVTTTVATMEALKELNLAGAEMLNLASTVARAEGTEPWAGATADEAAEGAGGGARGGGGGGGAVGWQAMLAGYYEGTLLRGQAVPEAVISPDAEIGQLTAEVIASVLEGVESALPWAPPAGRVALLGAVTALAGRSDPRSSARLLCLATQHRLAAAQAAAPHKAIVPWDLAGEWLAALPRLLWQLGNAQPHTTALALRMTLDVARLAPAGSPVAGLLLAQLPALQPFYCAVVAGGGGKKTKKKRKSQEDEPEPPSDAAPSRAVFGPFAKLPPDVQRLAVDVLYHQPDLPPELLRGLALCVLHPRVGADVACHAVAVVGARSRAGPATGQPLPPALVLSFALTLLVGAVAGVDPAAAGGGEGGGREGAGGEDRDAAVVDATCHMLLQGSDAGVLAEVLGPSLLRELARAPGARARGGLLAAAAALGGALSAGGAGGGLPASLVAALPVPLWQHAREAHGGGGDAAEVARADGLMAGLCAACPALLGPVLGAARYENGPGCPAALGRLVGDPRLAEALLGEGPRLEAACVGGKGADEGPDRDAWQALRARAGHLLGKDL